MVDTYEQDKKFSIEKDYRLVSLWQSMGKRYQIVNNKQEQIQGIDVKILSPQGEFFIDTKHDTYPDTGNFFIEEITRGKLGWAINDKLLTHFVFYVFWDKEYFHSCYCFSHKTLVEWFSKNRGKYTFKRIEKSDTEGRLVPIGSVYNLYTDISDYVFDVINGEKREYLTLPPKM